MLNWKEKKQKQQKKTLILRFENAGLICLKDETGRSGLVHWDDPEGWDGEGSGRRVQDGEHTKTHGWFMSMYGKNPYNIVISLQIK